MIGVYEKEGRSYHTCTLAHLTITLTAKNMITWIEHVNLLGSSVCSSKY